MTKIRDTPDLGPFALDASRPAVYGSTPGAMYGHASMSSRSSGRILLMRHGHTEYRQGNTPVPVEDACDLTPRGMAEVSRSSLEIAEVLKDAEDVRIYTSPLGRAIHTAKILKRRSVQPCSPAGPSSRRSKAATRAASQAPRYVPRRNRG